MLLLFAAAEVAYSQAHVTAMAPSARWLQFHPSALTRQEESGAFCTTAQRALSFFIFLARIRCF